MEKPIPTNKISAQVWNELSQILPIVKAQGKTKSIVGFQTGLTQTTKIDEIFPTLKSKQQLAAKLRHTYSADFNVAEIIQAETLGGLTKLIVSKLPRKLEPLGRP